MPGEKNEREMEARNDKKRFARLDEYRQEQHESEAGRDREEERIFQSERRTPKESRHSWSEKRG